MSECYDAYNCVAPRLEARIAELEGTLNALECDFFGAIHDNASLKEALQQIVESPQREWDDGQIRLAVYPANLDRARKLLGAS